jgi:hypothetical protein
VTHLANSQAIEPLTTDPANNRYVREEWTMFRTLQTISQKSGVEPGLLRRLVAKELADNSLDERATCRIGKLESGGFFVEDDGPGIAGAPEEIAELFSINRPLISSKVKRLPTRGALGNGLRVVSGVVLASSGHLEVSTRGHKLQLVPQELTGRTEVAEVRPCERKIGARVEIHLGDSVPADEDFLCWAEFAIDATGDEPIYKGNTSAFWYDSASWFEFLQAAGDRTVRNVLNDVDGCSGEAASKIAQQFLNRSAKSLSFAEAETLLHSIRATTSPVTERRFKFLGKNTFVGHYASERGTLNLKPGRGSIVAELPFTVEAWISSAEEDDIDVLVNRTPITGNLHVNRVDKKGNLGIFGCGLRHRVAVGKKPVDITLNIQIPYMPITSDGKAPDLAQFLHSICEGVKKAAKRCQRANATPRGEDTQKSIILDNLDRATQHASGGKYRFSLRTLFYSVRHFAALDHQPLPTWGWFCSVITEHEEQLGHDIPGMYRDNRGKIYVPHLGREIPLGTLTVEQYRHHQWTYNKVLYVEKEGLYEILKSAGWPERHDCLLVTSQGFATRAARDVIDLLGDSDQDLLFFAIHDADAYGTCIYQALQHGTAARPARRVKIFNLGLEPWQGLEMGLPIEPAEEGEKRKPVGDYVREEGEEWVEWLQTQRIELNAMTTPQFLAWLDACMEEHGNGKLIPPPEIMTEYLEQVVLDRVREAERERVLKEANYEKRVKDAFKRLRAALSKAAATLGGRVRSSLKKAAEEPWRKPIERMAERLTRSRPK